MASNFRNLILVEESDKAIKLRQEIRGRVVATEWIPKSQLNYSKRETVAGVGVVMEISIPDWLAEKKGFIE